MYHGTYGKSAHLNLPYRTDKGGGQADFITVGKIDNGRVGIFSEDKKLSYTEMVARWTLMNDRQKKDHLQDILAGESGMLPELLKDWDKHHPDKIPVFEVGNEPNLFPYISPGLYGWYYDQWVEKIERLWPSAKIMNGGFFCTSLLPKKIRKKLRLLGVRETDEQYWFAEFRAASIETPFALNLHVYPTTDSLPHVARAMHGFPGVQRVWLTEWGNINPLNMRDTVKFIKDLSLALQTKTNTLVDRMYYFQARHSERHFQIFHELRRRFGSELWWRRVTELYKFLFRRKSSWMRMVIDYISNPPIQSLEDRDGNLNEIGKLFKKLAGGS